MPHDCLTQLCVNTTTLKRSSLLFVLWDKIGTSSGGQGPTEKKK